MTTQARRRTAAGTWLRACDGWLAVALQGARERLGERWLEVYLTAPLLRFAWAPGVVDGQWWFGCYGNKLLKCDAELKNVEMFDFGASVGIAAAGEGRLLVARNKKVDDRHIGSTLVARPGGKTGLRLEPRKAE